jgi:uncharacterized protein (DUF433 family)
MATSETLLTPVETALVTGVPLKEVYKVARERLPGGLVVRGKTRMAFRPLAAVCIRIDHRLPKDISVKVRKAFYAEFKRNPQASTLEHKAGALSYRVETSDAAEAVTAGLTAYREAMDVIVEDPEIQGGAATFKGTRILVHTVADLLGAGASLAELKQDYPNLTDAMIDAARLFARTHPKRGRPRKPTWRSEAPRSSRTYPRTAA